MHKQGDKTLIFIMKQNAKIQLLNVLLNCTSGCVNTVNNDTNDVDVDLFLAVRFMKQNFIAALTVKNFKVARTHDQILM